MCKKKGEGEGKKVYWNIETMCISSYSDIHCLNVSNIYIGFVHASASPSRHIFTKYWGMNFVVTSVVHSFMMSFSLLICRASPYPILLVAQVTHPSLWSSKHLSTHSQHKHLAREECQQ